MTHTKRRPRARVGDVVAIEGRRVGQAGRSGQILEILGEPGHEHFRVRWEDGHESVFYPGADAVVRRKTASRGKTKPATSPSAVSLMRELAQKELGYELIPHAHTERAGDEATALGLEPGEVAKTVVVTTEEGYVRAVVPASERLDLHRVRDLVGGGKRTRLATEAELVAAYPMFELGAVPPFGGPEGDRVLVDRRLAERESVVLEAGSHDESVRMRTRDLLAVAHAETAELCVD
jgi:Ala-tRNA(Pro) deacylase